MKRLFVIVLVITGSFSAAAWRQSTIGDIRSEIDRLLAELQKAQIGLRDGQIRLDETEQSLQQWRAKANSLETARTETGFIPPPGPEVEGWWPANQPYFYLKKQLLPLVRFEDIDRTPEEIRASGQAFEANTDYSVENRLFSANRLNEQMMKLLGMTDAERASVEGIYDQLRGYLRSIEISKIQKLDPPQIVDGSRVIVARLPSLAADLDPLLESTRNSLQNILGANRAELLLQQAEQFFNRYCDGLGSMSREFILNNRSLSVLYSNEYGKCAKSTSYFCAPGRSDPWEYSHLFGPGSPCEIK
jgi:hypothetical protein